MTVDVSTLDAIFQMITPADLLGAQKLAIGKKVDTDVLRELLDALYNVGGGGALTSEALSERLTQISSKVTDAEAKKQFQRIIHLFKTGKPCEALGESMHMAQGDDGKTPITKVTWDQIVGGNVKLEKAVPPKEMGIVLCNSGFLSPQVRNAERVEMFLNFLPSIHASRMVPFLDIEFSFNAGVPKESAPHLWAPGMMKFLLGGDQSAVSDPSSPTAKMIGLREVHDEKRGTMSSISGMEMFLSPQTLVNPEPVGSAARHNDVIDPFRPLMSIESFTVNITPTVGLYSFKKGTLVFKLHDRSRLSEIGDIIRPQVYQDAAYAPTIWVTYGWRYPNEPGNPFADFVNGNMLVRDAYHIMNSQFSFDQTGQVQVTMQLWTKGIPEMRTIKINDDADSGLRVFGEIRAIAERISRYKNALGIGPVEGINKEIRSFMLIDSAERGAFPDMSNEEIRKSLDALKKSFATPGAKIDKEAADKLVKELDSYYRQSDKKNLDFKRQIQNQTTQVTLARFREVMIGADPFLPFAEKDKKKAAEMKSAPHPFSSIVEALNSYNGEAEIKDLPNPTGLPPPKFAKKAVSFGKLVSVFTANTFKMMDGIDEMQLFFYQFNDQAGAAASANIAEFPIDMPVFLDQYREFVEEKGSERLTLEEFLRLVVDAQLTDSRAIGYGFRSYFAPYDPANKSDAKLKTGTEQEYENALAGIGSRNGPFRQPAIEIHVETLYAAKGTTDVDLLHQFEVAAALSSVPNGGVSEQYTRIMRLHIFDRANNPYTLAGSILKAEDGVNFIEVEKELVKQTVIDKKKQATDVWSPVMKVLTPDAKIDRNRDGKINPQEVRNFVSKMVPTLVYGMNASAIISANLASKQDPLLATTQMQAVSKKSGKRSVLQPNGSGAGGLPLRIIPASLGMTTMGCPLLTFGQLFFVDFSTGTTADNIYGLTGITNLIAPGKFESNLTLTYYDSYGKFEGAPQIVDYMKQIELP